MEETIVKLSSIAEKIGNEPKEVTLPNGQTRMSVNWDGPTAQAAVKETTPLASQDGKVVFDGPAPAWFVSSLTHSVHPRPVGLNDPKIGIVDIPQLAKGTPNPECGVELSVSEGEKCVRVDWQLTDPVFDAAKLKDIVVPEIPNGKEVMIGGGTDILPNSGKGPNYIAVAIGEAYAHTNASVSYYQPQTQGYTTGITHIPGRKIGDVIPKAEIDMQIEQFKKAQMTDKIAQVANMSLHGRKPGDGQKINTQKL